MTIIQAIVLIVGILVAAPTLIIVLLVLDGRKLPWEK